MYYVVVVFGGGEDLDFGIYGFLFVGGFCYFGEWDGFVGGG